ncbi:MAG TPA: hypothetical protein VFZ91_02045 [Allosphingosinicella sp.]
MAAVTIMLRLGLAALVAAAAAGSLLTLSIFLGSLVAAPPPGWTTVELLAWLRFGIEAGLIVATLPAFVAGALMEALGMRAPAARRAAAWAAAGAVIGAALWALFEAALWRSHREPAMFGQDLALLAACLAAGAGAALAFRWVMRRTQWLERRRGAV